MMHELGNTRQFNSKKKKDFGSHKRVPFCLSHFFLEDSFVLNLVWGGRNNYENSLPKY